MNQLTVTLTAILLLGAISSGCASAPSSAPTGDGRSGQAERAPKRVTVAILSYPDTFLEGPKVSGKAGVDAIVDLIHVGLAVNDASGNLQPRLAEAVPTIETGLWKLLPDGRMETTWRIRDGVEWHDGQLLTARDLVFTTTVGNDEELPFSRDLAFDSFEGIVALDERTVMVTWSKPFILADSLFSASIGLPLPRHLLEAEYQANTEGFAVLPYWSAQFVGTGPFKLREWEPTSHMIADANPRYALGRPKIDSIEVKFITDANTLTANLLAGEVDVTMGRNVSIPQAVQIRDLWRDGRVDIVNSSYMVIFPQFLDPTPQAVTDVRFRRALLHAIDRQEMVETIQFGLSSVAHSFLNPNQSEYRDVESSIVRYDYDPRRAAQLLEQMGHVRGSDGVFRDSANIGPSLLIYMSSTDLNEKTGAAVADYWRRLGVRNEVAVTPAQRMTDREYRATFPSFEVTRNPNRLSSIMTRLSSGQIPLPETGFRGSNAARYASPEMDALTDRFLTTIPRQERMQVLGRILNRITDELIWMGLFYDAVPVLINNRLVNVGASEGESSTAAWNAHDWDLR